MFSRQKPNALFPTDRPQAVLRCPSGSRAEVAAPFSSAEQAWFWTMAALIARRDGWLRMVGPSRPTVVPEDVLRCLDGLYRHRRIDLLHARILRVWGERGRAPDPGRRAEQGDAAIWREAIGRLDWPLRVKGLVRPPTDS